MDKLNNILGDVPPYVVAITSLGGILHYFNNKLHKGHPFHFGLFILDVVNSGFLGITGYALSIELGMSSVGAAAISGIVAHLGSRAITLGISLLNRGTYTKEDTKNEQKGD